MMDYDKIMKHEKLQSIGQVAVFYLPKVKLDWDGYAVNHRTVRQQVHDFFIENHGAYTLDETTCVGFWQPKDGLPVRDENVRYEVSFGDDKVNEFVDFLSNLCTLIGEETIYLTMGYKSFLVKPKEGTDEV
jgi:hypothetical protein